MKSGISVVVCAGILCFGIFWTSPALADKAAVKIEAPAAAAKGEEITIRLTVTHNANTDRHYVDWVKLWVNNQEANKWEYASGKLPEGVPFTREFKVKAGRDLEIKAEASCNVHGGRGPVTHQIAVK